MPKVPFKRTIIQKQSYRRLEVSLRYDAILNDMERIKTVEFIKAKNKRFIIERRFATMVRNHGLRRSRYLGMPRTKTHITMANMASNIVRMVNLLYKDDLVTLKTL